MLVMALLHGGLEEASDTPNRCANVEEALRYRALADAYQNSQVTTAYAEQAPANGLGW